MALYEWRQESLNRVRNPSFEEKREGEILTDWKVPRSDYFHPDSNARTGKVSLVLQDSHRADTHPAAIQNGEYPSGWYDLSGWMRTRDAGSNKPGSGGRISVRGQGAGASTPVIRGTVEWTLVERKRFYLPAGSAQIRLEAYRKPDGTIHFDDVELRRLVSPVVEGFLLYPNYRGLLFPDRSQSIRFSLAARPEELQLGLMDVRVEVGLVPEGATAPSITQSFTPSTAQFVVELDASGLPLGPYLLTLRCVRQKTGEVLSQYPSYRIIKVRAGDRERYRTYVDDDNVLVLDGTRRFALGIYNTSGYSNSPRAYEDAIAKIAEAPIDLYINYWLGRAPNSALSALTSTLRKHGMYYLHTVNRWYEDSTAWPHLPPCAPTISSRTNISEDQYTACRSRELGSLPGLAGWYTADERPAAEAARVFKQYLQLREGDPDGITFIAQNQVDELGQWRDSADVFDLHRYPIFNVPEGELSPLEEVYERTHSAVRTLERSRPVWAVIQYFPHGSKGHWPTYDELRSMSYMAIVGGAKGLLYWSFGAKGLAWVKDPVRKEDIWRRLVTVTKEIKTLEPFLLQPDAPEILTSSPASDSIRVLAKTYNGERLLIAVNLTPQEVPVEFRLSQSAGSITTTNGDRAIRLGEGKSFRDSFAAYAAHVYLIRD